jgi:hypothetical protein
MTLRVLFPMVKTAALYPRPIESDLDNRQVPFILKRIVERIVEGRYVKKREENTH